MHEPVAHCQSFDQLRREWEKPFEFVGVSDSGLMFQLGKILAEISPRTLIIKRPIDDVVRSFERYLDGVEFDPLAMRRMLSRIDHCADQFKTHPLVKTVSFDALRDWTVVEDCYRWLMPNNPHKPSRELQHTNIQVEIGHALAQMRKPHTQWHLEE